MSGVFDGVRVLDFGRFIAGPYCGLLLAQMGAEVIRVEQPGGDDDRYAGFKAGDGETFLFKCLSYCKKSITLDMQSEKGRSILRDLVRHTDIVVENFSPKGAEIMGLSYETMKETNPAIIVVSIRGFASIGVYQDRLGFDPTAQAMSGGMFQTGFPGNPPTRCAVRYVDYGTGISAAYGAAAALYHREKTGRGQQVEVPLFDTAVVMNGGPLAEYAVLGVERTPTGNRGYNMGPSDLYKAQDGWVYLLVIGDSTFKRFLRLVGREELFGDPRFGDDISRFAHRDILDPLAANWVAERTVEQVVAGLIAARIPCGPVYDSPHVLNDPYVQERRLLVELDFPQVGRVPVPGMHVRMDGAGEVKLASPMLGSANRNIYQELLQYTDDQLSELKDQGII